MTFYFYEPFSIRYLCFIIGFTLLIQFRLPDPDEPPQLTADRKTASFGIGLVFCIIGFSCFFVGLGKYFKTQKLLVKQATFVEAGWGSYLMVAILFLFVCTVMILALQQ